MPILRQLGEEGLPEGFSQFWYGSLKERKVSSPLAPMLNAEQIDDISNRHLSRHEQGELFLDIHQGLSMEDFSPSDPLVQALWQGEREALIGALQDMGAEETLQLFLEEEENHKERWAECLGKGYQGLLETYQRRELSDQDKYPSSHIPVSILPHLLSDATNREKILAELEKKIIPWSKEDPEGFHRFLTHITLPAMQDISISRNHVFPSGKECAQAALEALAGPDYWRQLEKDVAILRKAGYFESGASEDDVWSFPLENTGLYLLSNEGCANQDKWNDHLYYNLMIDAALRRYTTYLGHTSINRNKFLQSDLGAKVLDRLGIKADNADEKIQQIAESFNDEIRQKILSGEIDLLEAWELAAEEASSTGKIQ
jgi:hypothetical protein